MGVTHKLRTLITDNHRTVYPADIITTTENSRLHVESVTVFWNYDNVTRGVNDTWAHSGNTLTVPEGYWTAGMISRIKSEVPIRVKPTGSADFYDVTVGTDFEESGSGGWSVNTSVDVNLGTFGTLLGFDKNTTVTANKKVISQNTADLNLGLKYVTVGCDLVDETRNVDPNDNRSSVVATIPVPTNADLKRTIGQHYQHAGLSVPVRTGVHNKVTFNVNTNLGPKSIGDVLVEMYIVQ